MLAAGVSGGCWIVVAIFFGSLLQKIMVVVGYFFSRLSLFFSLRWPDKD